MPTQAHHLRKDGPGVNRGLAAFPRLPLGRSSTVPGTVTAYLLQNNSGKPPSNHVDSQ